MPVITSGKVFDIPADSGLIYEQSENSDINFDEIVSFVERFYQDKDSINKIDSILKQFEWKTIMDKVVRCTLNVR